MEVSQDFEDLQDLCRQINLEAQNLEGKSQRIRDIQCQICEQAPTFLIQERRPRVSHTKQEVKSRLLK